MKHRLHRRYGLQLAMASIRAIALSFAILIAVHVIYILFKPILRPTVQYEEVFSEAPAIILSFTLIGWIALGALAVHEGRKRGKDDPFRFAAFAEKYFRVDDKSAGSVVSILSELGFDLRPDSLDLGRVHAEFVSKFATVDPSDQSLVQHTRRAVVDMHRKAGTQWIGRIRVEPTLWLVFVDEADLSRVVLKQLADRLQVVLSDDLDQEAFPS